MTQAQAVSTSTINPGQRYMSVNIQQFEQLLEGKYICETSVKTRSGWLNQPVAVFYIPNPKDLIRYVGIYVDDVYGTTRKINANSCTEPFTAIRAKNGEIIYSKFKDDYMVSSDGTAWITGGRVEVRGGLDKAKGKPTPFVTLQIYNGKIVQVNV